MLRPKSISNKLTIFVYALNFSLCIFLYQNCSEGFVVNSPVVNNSTASCSAKISNEKFMKLAQLGQLECDNLNNIVCDYSIFSPSVQDSQSSESVCELDDYPDQCIKLNKFMFNTSMAYRASANEADFQPGGSYNQEEFRCSLKDATGFILKITQADSLNKAMSMLIQECKMKVALNGN